MLVSALSVMFEAGRWAFVPFSGLPLHTGGASIKAVAFKWYVNTINMIVDTTEAAFTWMEKTLVPEFMPCCGIETINMWMH